MLLLLDNPDGFTRDPVHDAYRGKALFAATGHALLHNFLNELKVPA